MIHYFKSAGLNLVLDVESGAVHTVDDVTYRLLSILSEEEIKNKKITTDISDVTHKYGKATVQGAIQSLYDAVDGGLLYAENDYTRFSAHLGIAPIKAMCLHIAHDCNLRCQYCFASTGDFGGSRSIMSFETAKKAIDFLISQSENRRNLEVDFFGGEPLLNFSVVQQTVEYARSIEKKYNKHFRFTITTNGLGLNKDIAEYINYNMDNVVLSLDGRKSIHDTMRPTPGNQGSYDIVTPKMKALIEHRGDKEYYIRGTYTKYNLDFNNDVLSLSDEGFDQISVEPVVVPDDIPYSIQEEDIPAIKQSYDQLLNEMISRHKNKTSSFNFFHFMLDLDNGPCAIKRLKGCGSGNEYIAITPEGDIYPCHQFVGNEAFLMGSVHTNTLNSEMKKTFANANLLNKTECSDCWAKYHCSGGCNANNYNFNGDILSPHKLSCTLEKMRLEKAVALQVSKKLLE